MSHQPTYSIRCSGCGGRNQSDTILCEFCALALQRVKAARSARRRLLLATAWIAPTLIALALLSMLIVRLVAMQIAAS
jgi:hypothetical protein